jgi:hypothetical protein
MMNSSTCPESRKAATSSAPPTSKNVLAFLRAEPFGERGHVFANDFHLGAGSFRQRARENVILLLRVPFSHSKAHREVVGLAPQNAGVDGTIEFRHTVVTLRVWTVKPVHRAVSSCAEAISTNRNVDDEFALTSRFRQLQ